MSIKADTAPAISVIVPVYNVQDYIAECLDSLANQRFDNRFEIILVDDCSTDDSKIFCEDFVAAHQQLARFIGLSQNSGSAVARNTGIKAARGDYFAFIDPDDIVPPDALQNLYDAAITHQADIVKGNNTIFNEQGSYPASYNVDRTKIYTDDAILAMFLEHKETRGHPWGKLFRKSACADVVYPPGVAMAQDALYCAEVFSLAKKMVLIDDTVYHYRLRKTGATGRKFQTGAYLWWLYSIENCGRFATTSQQLTNFKELQIRTLLQLVREARALNKPLLDDVVEQVITWTAAWQIHLPTLLKARVSTKGLLHFIKFKLTLAKLKRRAKLQ